MINSAVSKGFLLKDKNEEYLLITFFVQLCYRYQSLQEVKGKNK